MYIVFTSDSCNLLPLNKEIPLHSVNQILNQLNETLLNNDETATVGYKLLAENRQCIYESFVEMPEIRFSLYKKIESSFEGDLTEEQQTFLETIKKEFEPIKIKKKSMIPSFEKFSLSQVALVVGVFVVLFMMTMKMNQLQTHITNLENKEQATVIEELPTSKIDTFSRYFLSNYFSEGIDNETLKKKLEPYVTNDLLKEIAINNQQLRSSLLWEIKEENDEYIVSYVVSVKEDEQVNTKLISFTIAEQKNSEYKITKLSKLNDFEMKITKVEE